MKLSLLLLLLAFTKCNTRIQYKDIAGCWKLQSNDISYPEICINPDSTVLFSSRADTLYRFKTIEVNSSLKLADQSGAAFDFPILYFGSDSLVLMDVMINHKALIYKRERKRN